MDSLLQVLLLSLAAVCLCGRSGESDEERCDVVSAPAQAQQLRSEQILFASCDQQAAPQVTGRARDYLADEKAAALCEAQPDESATVHQLRAERKRSLKLERALRDLLLFALFFGVLFVLAFEARPPQSFAMYRVLDERLLHNFSLLTNASNFTKFLLGDLLNNLYAPSWYNGRLLTWNEQLAVDDGQMQLVRVGVPRLRQQRLQRSSTCTIASPMQSEADFCRPDYNWLNADTGSYAPAWGALNETDAASYQSGSGNASWMFSESDLRAPFTYAPDAIDTPYTALVNTYLPGGYVLPLKLSYAASYALLNATLRNFAWTDLYTRALFVEFTLYNPPVNVFVSVTLVGEFLASGGVVTTSDVKARALFLAYYIPNEHCFFSIQSHKCNII